MFDNWESRTPKWKQMKLKKYGLLICNVSLLNDIRQIDLICQRVFRIVWLHHRMEFRWGWCKSKHQFSRVRKNKWKCCMCCSRGFLALSSMCLDDKPKVQLIKLELQRRRSRKILRQRYPNFCRPIYGKVDSMTSVGSNTSRQHFLIRKSWLN